VETALFFSREIQGAAGGGGQQPQQPPLVPVILLSNDNGQVALAKSHGLPALRLQSGDAADRALRSLLLPPAPAPAAAAAAAPVTATALREALAPFATAGVSVEAAPMRSLQTELDGAVAVLGAAVAGYEDLLALLRQVAAATTAGGGGSKGRQGSPGGADDPVARLAAVRRLLADHRHDPGLFEGQGQQEEGAAAAAFPALASAERAVDALRARAAALGGLVRTTQAPSRVMRWAMAAPGAGEGKGGGKRGGSGGNGANSKNNNGGSAAPSSSA